MYDICIVGAGVAGSSLAAVLGKKGFRVALVERNWSEPDGIIGELLQPGGVDKIKEMGLEQALVDIDAQPITGYAILSNNKWLKLSYEQHKEFAQQSGFGFRYGSFVQGLRKLCQADKNVSCLEGNVTGLIEDNQRVTGLSLKNSDEETEQIEAKLTIVSQGSISALAKNLSKSKIDSKGYMLGLILKDCDLPFENSGHIILAEPAPILCYPVGTNKIRVLIDFPAELPKLTGEERKLHLLEKVMPQMPAQLQGAFAEAVNEGNLKAKGTCHLAARPILKAGVMLLGDSLNMRHPITGGGMTVALTDVKSLSDKLTVPQQLDKPLMMQEMVPAFYRQRHQEDATINILSFALYSIFRHQVLKDACFDYLQKGGAKAEEPMSLLSGQSRKRKVLFKHFFAVAGHAIFNRNKIRNGNGYGLWQSISALVFSVKILIPLLLDEIPRVYKK